MILQFLFHITKKGAYTIEPSIKKASSYSKYLLPPWWEVGYWAEYQSISAYKSCFFMGHREATDFISIGISVEIVKLLLFFFIRNVLFLVEISNKYQEFRIEHQESNVEMLLISLPPFGLWLDGLCLLHFFLISYSTLKPSCNDIYSIELFLLFYSESQNCCSSEPLAYYVFLWEIT